jgi:hypothetical protein
MKDKVLIDSSAWIVSFKKTGNERLKQMIVEVLNTFSAVTTNIIILELLQGCRNRGEFENLYSRLSALEVLPVNDEVWQIAYHVGYEMRKKGVTIPTVDITIASVAKAHGCLLLHHDRHFKVVARHLKIATIDFLD